MLELKGIVKKFGQNTVVNHVDLLIRDGEFFTLLGPSGCGKTTLLRMIAGFNDRTRGIFCSAGNPFCIFRRTGGIPAWCSRTMRCFLI